ncbi:PREDICTED: uncharacterized protein LOC108355928 [Rhagoletis zephyria]|uniref:uncharacterized protein LOC108355928 n=1 Tax=Rhagoletis zephyria TaxID=28612 RepID=UPI000811A448|nr:PREDICTED: uncharacterized protein LOC108355928 [Rhagoletis zephyria]
MASRSKAEDGIPFETLKEVIPTYDGGDGFSAWYNQVLHYREIFKANDAMLCVAVHLNLKGAALAWYNAKSTFHKSADELQRNMKTVFTSNERKLERRRKFEKRMWVPEESFISYYNDKCTLSSDLSLSDEEFADYLIEGIPDRQLRTQARLHNFASANEVVRAFRSVTLPEPPAAKPRSDERFRCYNCNCSGHYAKDCRKAKREAGSCYACGEKGHYGTDCKQYKREKNTFNV